MQANLKLKSLYYRIDSIKFIGVVIGVESLESPAIGLRVDLSPLRLSGYHYKSLLTIQGTDKRAIHLLAPL